MTKSPSPSRCPSLRATASPLARILAGSDPHQPEVWFRDHEHGQEGPESLLDGKDAAQQQPHPTLCLIWNQKVANKRVPSIYMYVYIICSEFPKIH